MTDKKEPKICVIMATYFRKNGTTKNLLSKALINLEAQTYKNFKLFLIGDHYDNNDEFEELCKSYKNEIYYKNNEEHYRCYNFPKHKIHRNIRGSLALKTGIEKAIEEKYDYYFHLDDDFTWIDTYIEVVVKHIKQFPLADFIFTKAYYINTLLPKTNEINIFYNNYIHHRGEDFVCASHIYRLSILGNVILDIINKNHILANKINNKEDIRLAHGDFFLTEHVDIAVLAASVTEDNDARALSEDVFGKTHISYHFPETIGIAPLDKTILDNINYMIIKDKIKSLYIPVITATNKETKVCLLFKNLFNFDKVLPVPLNLPMMMDTIYLTDNTKTQTDALSKGWKYSYVTEKFLNSVSNIEKRNAIAYINCYPEKIIPYIKNYDYIFICDSNVIKLDTNYGEFINSVSDKHALYITSGWYNGIDNNIEKELERSLLENRWSYDFKNIIDNTHKYLQMFHDIKMSYRNIPVAIAKYIGWNINHERKNIIADYVFNEYCKHLQGNIIFSTCLVLYPEDTLHYTRFLNDGQYDKHAKKY